MRNSFFIILAVVLLLGLVGVSSIYSSTYQKQGGLWEVIYQRQLVWFVLGIILFALISSLNYRWLWDWTYFFYAAVIIFLLLVFILGSVRSGAQRWLNLFWFNFQPSELAKLIMAVFLARYFSRKSADEVNLLSGKFGIFRGLALPLFFISLPMFLIIQQPDLGSGVMLLFLFLSLLYLTDVKIKYIVIFFLLLGLLFPLSWHTLKGYQKERLLVFLNPDLDPLGAGYTVIQSKIAIGSGGLFGKGWLAGTQSQLHFLPESHTDFIFATFVEQWGFLGGAALLFLYSLLIRQGFVIARRTSDSFGRLLAYGISLVLAIQVFVNIAMTMGLAPVVGLPLPLMSYGGSSVVVTLLSLGILVSIDKHRAVF